MGAQKIIYTPIQVTKYCLVQAGSELLLMNQNKLSFDLEIPLSYLLEKSIGMVQPMGKIFLMYLSLGLIVRRRCFSLIRVDSVSGGLLLERLSGGAEIVPSSHAILYECLGHLL